jgi:hypothetical protein
MAKQFKFTFADLPPNIQQYFPEQEIPSGKAHVGLIKASRACDALVRADLAAVDKIYSEGPPSFDYGKADLDMRWLKVEARAKNGCLVSQNGLYLRDCLRAGHVKGTGEYTITPDAIKPRYAAYVAESISIHGSPGAMCTSIA